MDSKKMYNCFRHAHFKIDSEIISNETSLSENPTLVSLEISRIEKLIDDINEIKDYT